MIAPNFEQEWMASEPPPDTPAIKNMQSILAGIAADMDNHVWIEPPEAKVERPAETLAESSPEPLIESNSRFTEATIEQRRHHDRVRREDLLAELRQVADTPPVPPIEEPPGDRHPDDGRPDGAVGLGLTIKPSPLRRCPVCDGTGRRWMLFTCRRCGGLGAIFPDR